MARFHELRNELLPEVDGPSEKVRQRQELKQLIKQLGYNLAPGGVTGKIRIRVECS